MKVLICGSRTFTNREAIVDRIWLLPADAEVIHGGAMGADSIAAHEAHVRGLKVAAFMPDWSDGPRAGLKRNLRMLDERPDLVLAFWDSQSKGTMHTITHAKRRGIPVQIIFADGSRAFGTRKAARLSQESSQR